MWLWSKLSSKKWQDAWDERFHGNPNSVITELSTGKSLRVEVYCETEGEAKVIQDQFGGSIRELKMKNWVAMAETKRPPIKIRDAIVVTSERGGDEVEELEKEFPNRHIIKMPAEMAFGTGDHATTSTCLRFLVDIAREQEESWEMLDLGCGTAILAIAARMMGAELCEAHDFDPQAVRVSIENVKLNGSDKIDVKEQDVLEWEPERTWDVVVANMFSTILQKAFPTIVKSIAANGQLVVSGILSDQWEETKAVGEESGLTFTKVIKKGKWVSARATLTSLA